MKNSAAVSAATAADAQSIHTVSVPVGFAINEY